jgi:intracellular septation protein
MKVLESIGLVLLGAIVVTNWLFARRLRLDLAEARRRGINSGVFDKWHDRHRQPLLFPFLTALGPLLLFVASYFVTSGTSAHRIYLATTAFAITTTAAMIARLAKPSRRGRKVPWAKLLTIVMSCLTLWFHDDRFIKTGPTIQYAGGAVWIMGLLLFARPKLEARLARRKIVLEREALGRLAVTMSALCLLMATLNELVWRTTSTGFWIVFQLWGPLLFFGAFAVASLPLLRRDFPAGECPVRTAE